MSVPWLPSELWAEIELRQFGDSLTWLGMKNRRGAVKQWCRVMVHAPVSKELESFLRAVELCKLGLCGLKHEAFEEIRDLSDWQLRRVM